MHMYYLIPKQCLKSQLDWFFYEICLWFGTKILHFVLNDIKIWIPLPNIYLIPLLLFFLGKNVFKSGYLFWKTPKYTDWLSYKALDVFYYTMLLLYTKHFTKNINNDLRGKLLLTKRKNLFVVDLNTIPLLVNLTAVEIFVLGLFVCHTIKSLGSYD